MGVEVLSSVATSVDPTWIGAMLYTYPIQFCIWTLLVFGAGVFIGFLWERRKADLAKDKAELLKIKSEYELELLHSMQEQNKELLASFKRSNEELIKVSEKYEKLLMTIESEEKQSESLSNPR